MTFDKFLQWVKQYSNKISLFHVILLNVFFALISIINMHGGILADEMYMRLPFYMSDTPLLNKVFDSQILDDGYYRARELSYFLDFINSKFIEFSIESGLPHFLSLTHYLFAIITGCLLWSFCVKELNLKPIIGIGWLTLFWTSPCIFLGGSFFRAGKMGVALLIAILFYVIYKVVAVSKEGFDCETQISKKILIIYSMAIFIITFLDEQGLFFAIIAILFLAIWGLIVRHKNIYIMFLTGTGSVLLHVLYRYIIAPQLTFMLNDYLPDLSYQTLSVQSFIKNIAYFLLSGLFLYVETFRFLIGNPPSGVGYGLLIFFISIPFFYLYTNSGMSANDRKLFILALIGLLITNLLLVITMYAVMVLRHPSLISIPSITQTYYSLPTNVLIAMTLAILTGVLYKLRIPKSLVLIMICVAITGNIVALNKNHAINIQDHMKPIIRNSSVLLNALKNLDSLNDVGDPLVEGTMILTFFKSKKKNPPYDANAYNEKGIFYAERGQYRLAIEHFNNAVILNPKDIQSYNNRGNIYLKLLQYQRAIEDFNNAIGLKPDFAYAYYNRGLAYFRLNNDLFGCRDAKTACALGNCKLLEPAIQEGYCH